MKRIIFNYSKSIEKMAQFLSLNIYVNKQPNIFGIRIKNCIILEKNGRDNLFFNEISKNELTLQPKDIDEYTL